MVVGAHEKRAKKDTDTEHEFKRTPGLNLVWSTGLDRVSGVGRAVLGEGGGLGKSPSRFGPFADFVWHIREVSEQPVCFELVGRVSWLDR